MNTIRSVSYGWGVLIAAGAGAYIMAKSSLADDKKARVNADKDKQSQQAQLRRQETGYRVEQQIRDEMGPGAKDDPAATRHEPLTEGQKVLEKSKYAATEVFRSPKGNRFS